MDEEVKIHHNSINQWTALCGDERMLSCDITEQLSGNRQDRS
jgi:hypothetical protein